MHNLSEKTWHRLALVLLGFVAGAIFYTFQDYGVSWDEEIQSQYGQAIVDYYQSGFVDHRADEIFNLYLYGGMFDGLASFLDRSSPLGIYPTRHLLNALFGLLGLWGTWRLGRFLGGGAVGFLSLLLLASTPLFYGHMFNNPKDIPFLAGVMWCLYYMAKFFRVSMEGRGRFILLAIKLGVLVGLTLGVRVGGIMLPAYFTMLYMFRHRTHLKKAIGILIPVGILAYAVMLVCWPWAQENPIVNPIRALGEFSNFPQDVEVLLDGTIYRSTNLPWNYVPDYFMAQLPIHLLALLVLSAVMCKKIWKDLRAKTDRYSIVLILMMAFLPILYAVWRRPALYDAVRHFTFAIPLFCVISALGTHQMLTSLLTPQPVLSIWSQKLINLLTAHLKPTPKLTTLLTFGGRISFSPRKWAAKLIIAIVIGSSLSMGWAMYRLHPYEYIYINPLAGGVSGAFGRFELDYWGSSFKEAAEQLQDFVAQEGGVPAGTIYRVAICGPWSSAMIYLPPDYQAVMANEEADFFLSTTRWGCQTMREGREIITIKRMGAPLSIIKDLR